MYKDIAILILRIGMGALLLPHGTGKIKRLSSFPDINFSDPIGLGPALSLLLTLFAEVICALMIIIGYKTRLATIPLLILFFIITFVIHGQGPWAKQELALLYFCGFAALYFLDSGKFSVDYLLNKNKSKRGL